MTKLTDDELKALAQKSCPLCGTQRCTGMFDEFFREGCKHYQMALVDKNKPVIQYKLEIARCTETELGINMYDVINILEDSGIGKIIDDDPEIAMRYPPEEWVENVKTYLEKKNV